MNLDAPIKVDGAPALKLGRVKNLVCGPTAEWDRIADERASVAGLFLGWVAPLAAIGPIALVCNGLMFPGRHLAGAPAFSVASLIWTAVALYAVSLIMTYLTAIIIDALAPRFGGRRDRVQAFKLAAYAGAAAWIAGVALLTPWLFPLALGGAGYSLVLLYRGLPRLMRSPCQCAMPYCGLAVGAVLAFGVLVLVAVGSVTAVIQEAAGAGRALAGAGALKLPGGHSVDLAGLAAAARQAQFAAEASHTAAPDSMKALAPERLETLFPDQVHGLARRAVSGERRSAAGASATRANADYGSGPVRVSLHVSDLAAASALASVATALDLEQSRETRDGYVKVEKVDGRLAVAVLDRRRGRGRYSVLVADRFLVEADGQGLSMDALMAAAASLDYGRLTDLARGPGPSEAGGGDAGAAGVGAGG